MLQFSVHQVKTIDPLRNWVQEWYQTENGSKSEHHMEGGGKSPLSLPFKSISPTPLLQMFHKSISPSRSISSSPHLSISSLLPTFFSWFLPPSFFRAILPSSSFLFLRFACGFHLAQNFHYIIHEVYSGSQRTVVWTNKMAGISADSVEPVLLFCDTFSHPENEVSVKLMPILLVLSFIPLTFKTQSRQYTFVVQVWRSYVEKHHAVLYQNQ